MTVFDDLVGQRPVVAQLKAAVAAAREGTGGMTHAWLFTGPPGSGREAAASAFAAALQCTEEPAGCGYCAACHQVLAGTHADLEVVRPQGLSYSVRATRELVLRAAARPSGGRWQIVLFEDADRATEAAANALLKAIEEPPPKTVWLLCAPSPDDLVMTIRSRCRLVTLRTPPVEDVTALLVQRDGVEPELARVCAQAAQGDIARARQLAGDPSVRARRADVLAVPARLTAVGPAALAAESLVKTAEEEAKAMSEQLNESETAAMRQALGESAKGRMPRGTAGALKDLEDRQKSRATRIKRDALDRALLDLASFYRDLLALQFGARVPLVNGDRSRELGDQARRITPEGALRRLDSIMACRERLAANVNPLLAVEALMMELRTG
ncbi:DNA polymerase III subunit delta' [Actinocorallia sp. API 0066]|uniref:DNA polymerase III subunit delta' n=1 Tax=Actinocorallia sp. API 0066 TaxID=2896846 RepID=UPI001E3B50AA|nr:DNA polymerase III subunit delta' [Actinocorallia sp. API 0066]MCD0450453.1 DNA polymerase III subunit delta' [Actinocorallia sp. API 0066]